MVATDVANTSGSESMLCDSMSKETFLIFQYDLLPNTLSLITHDSSDFKEFVKTGISIVGIDTERPPYCKRRITSLLQLALRNIQGEERVYLIDLLMLNKNEIFSNELDAILEILFHTDSIIKVGQGLRQDFNELSHSYPKMKSFKICKSILETNTLHRFLNPEIKHNISLRNFTRIYLHFDLDKSCQMSNWKYRPLSQEQILYAACDALVLLRLYDVMIYEAEYQCNFYIQDLFEHYYNKAVRHLQPPSSDNNTPNKYNTNDSNIKSTNPQKRSRDENAVINITPSSSSNRGNKKEVIYEQQDDVVDMTTKKFYSFAERYWYTNEMNKQGQNGQKKIKTTLSPSTSTNDVTNEMNKQGQNGQNKIKTTLSPSTSTNDIMSTNVSNDTISGMTGIKREDGTIVTKESTDNEDVDIHITLPTHMGHHTRFMEGDSNLSSSSCNTPITSSSDYKHIQVSLETKNNTSTIMNVTASTSTTTITSNYDFDHSIYNRDDMIPDDDDDDDDDEEDDVAEDDSENDISSSSNDNSDENTTDDYDDDDDEDDSSNDNVIEDKH